MARFRVPYRTAKRGFIAHVYSHHREVYVVNEFPKSGGTWLCNLLSTALALPFHNSVTPPLEPQILKGHFYFYGGIQRGVALWRDGRDVMTSLYHHSFHKFADIPSNHAFVDMMRAKYHFRDYDDVRTNLPEFLEREMTRPSYPSFTWAQFVRKWHTNKRMVHVRYEALRNDPEVTLADLVERLTNGLRVLSSDEVRSTLEKFDIKRIVQNRGVPSNGKRFFVRSGKIGSWRDHYSEEALEIFYRHAGDALRTIGYK